MMISSAQQLTASTEPVIPERYVVNYSITHCVNCGYTERHSELFALSFLRSRFKTGAVKHLVRCDRPMYNLPVDRQLTGQHSIAFCIECHTIDLTHLPPPPTASGLHDLAEPALKGGIARGASAAKSTLPPVEASPPRTGAQERTRKPTLDELA